MNPEQEVEMTEQQPELDPIAMIVSLVVKMILEEEVRGITCTSQMEDYRNNLALKIMGGIEDSKIRHPSIHVKILRQFQSRLGRLEKE